MGPALSTPLGNIDLFERHVSYGQRSHLPWVVDSCPHVNILLELYDHFTPLNSVTAINPLVNNFPLSVKTKKTLRFPMYLFIFFPLVYNW